MLYRHIETPEFHSIGRIYFCLRYAAADRVPFGERLGIWAFWLCNGGLVLWIALNFFPIGWPQLAAVYEHGLAYARAWPFTIRRCSGSGCACREMWSLRSARC
jgi:nitric oxide reductase large subunit